MRKSAKNTTPLEVLAAQFFSDHRDQFISFTIMTGVSGLLISWKDVSHKNGHIIEDENLRGHYSGLEEDDTSMDLIVRLGIPRNRVTFVSDMTLTETPPPGRRS